MGEHTSEQAGRRPSHLIEGSRPKGLLDSWTGLVGLGLIAAGVLVIAWWALARA